MDVIYDPILGKLRSVDAIASSEEFNIATDEDINSLFK